jgi:hypothetical protein
MTGKNNSTALIYNRPVENWMELSPTNGAVDDTGASPGHVFGSAVVHARGIVDWA